MQTPSQAGQKDFEPRHGAARRSESARSCSLFSVFLPFRSFPPARTYVHVCAIVLVGRMNDERPERLGSRRLSPISGYISAMAQPLFLIPHNIIIRLMEPFIFHGGPTSAVETRFHRLSYFSTSIDQRSNPSDRSIDDRVYIYACVSTRTRTFTSTRTHTRDHLAFIKRATSFRCTDNLSFQRQPYCTYRSQFNVKDVRFIRSCREETATLLFQRPTSYRRKRASGACEYTERPVLHRIRTYVFVRFRACILVRSRVVQSNASAPTTVAQTVSIYVRIKMLGYQIRSRAQTAGARKKGCGKRERGDYYIGKERDSESG